ncbi:MAG: hypothetical protein ACJAU9_000914 [Lentimonas sp.]|jgi:hypothetical protein
MVAFWQFSSEPLVISDRSVGTHRGDPSNEGESPSLHSEMQCAPAVIVDTFFRGAQSHANVSIFL